MHETLTALGARYPGLQACLPAMQKAAQLLIHCFTQGGRLYLCGNGGSAADADHIVGELMKGFLKRRPLTPEQRAAFAPEEAALADGLMQGLPAISLHSQTAWMTAFMNDEDPALVYAQAVYCLGRPGDVLMAISTSGNSDNVVAAARAARARGMAVLTLTGQCPCALDPLSTIALHVQARETYRVQELHLPLYHWLCATVEEHFFPT